MEDKISESLGIEPKPETPKQEILVPTDDKVDNDFKYTRENLYNIIELGNAALEEMVDVAKQSESPRAYEVVSDLLKAIVSANKDLLDLSKKKKELEAPEEEEKEGVTNNNLFLGSTEQLQKLISGE